MENKLKIKLHSTGEWGILEGYPSWLGATGENDVTSIMIQIPSFLKGWNHFLEFSKPDGSKILTERLKEELEDGVRYATYVVKSSTIDVSGKYKMEYHGTNGSKTWKSKAQVTLDVYKSINAGEQLETDNPEFVAWVTMRFEELEKTVNTNTKSLVHGVRFYGEDPTGVRLYSSANLTAGINGEKNDFDKMYPWCDMEEVLLGSDDIFIKIPLFYCAVNKGTDSNDEEYTDLIISGIPQDGLKPHSAFLRADGSIASCIYVAKYEAAYSTEPAAENNRTLVSKPNHFPANNITIGDFRTLARRSGYQLLDIRQQSAINVLFTIEFATRNCQSVVRGLTDCLGMYPGDELDYQENPNSANVVIQSLDYAGWEEETITKIINQLPIITISDDNDGTYYGQRNIVSFEFFDKQVVQDGETSTLRMLKVEFDGDPINFNEQKQYGEDEEPSTVYWCFNVSGYLPTGLTKDRIGSTTGSKVNDAISYRGIENPWGNFYKFLDGVLLTGTRTGSGTSRVTEQRISISFDPSRYDDLLNDSYKEYAYKTWTGSTSPSDKIDMGGYVSDIRVVEGFDGVNLPSEGDASEETGYCDYSYIGFPDSEDYSYIIYHGGDSFDGSNAGLFFFNGDRTTCYDMVIGARLSIVLPEGD